MASILPFLAVLENIFSLVRKDLEETYINFKDAYLFILASLVALLYKGVPLIIMTFLLFFLYLLFSNYDQDIDEVPLLKKISTIILTIVGLCFLVEGIFFYPSEYILFLIASFIVFIMVILLFKVGQKLGEFTYNFLKTGITDLLILGVWLLYLIYLTKVIGNNILLLLEYLYSLSILIVLIIILSILYKAKKIKEKVGISLLDKNKKRKILYSIFLFLFLEIITLTFQPPLSYIIGIFLTLLFTLIMWKFFFNEEGVKKVPVIDENSPEYLLADFIEETKDGVYIEHYSLRTFPFMPTLVSLIIFSVLFLVLH